MDAELGQWHAGDTESCDLIRGRDKSGSRKMDDHAIETLEDHARQLKHAQDLSGALRCRKQLELEFESAGVTLIRQVHNLSHIALLSAKIGDYSEAECAARKALSLSRDFPRESQATCSMQLAAVLAEAGNFDEAIAFAQQAVDLFELVHGPENEFVMYRKNDLERMRRRENGSYLEL